ncbi:MAG: hypothetical protein HeimAB125_14910 [Candidatus Heimdallarchaeota archaeon AB_125]|nr:MAG: hypothetical protein HeimAB125_14910 [Candidatus Heimdallarchaeota archaeon AB_125]
MVKIFCSKCGKLHETEGKICENCGEDLEGSILRYKQKHLPIKYENASKIPPNMDEETYKKQKAKAERREKTQVVFAILTLGFGVGLLLIVIFANWANQVFISLTILLGLVFLVSIVTTASLSSKSKGRTGTGCCSGSDCSGCDCGGCNCADCAGDCGDCGSGCDCSGCDISC